MEFDEVVRGRRSIRGYLRKPAMGIARKDTAMRHDWVLRGFRQFVRT
jgi:hypothetical protein